MINIYLINYCNNAKTPLTMAEVCKVIAYLEGYDSKEISLIEEIEHAELVRDGNDLLYNTFIGFPEAVLGDSVEIPTLEGKVKVKIEPGTQPGKILRLKGKGIPDVNGYGKGDLLVKVNVWIPKNLSKEDKKTMEELKNQSFLKPIIPLSMKFLQKGGKNC